MTLDRTDQRPSERSSARLLWQHVLRVALHRRDSNRLVVRVVQDDDRIFVEQADLLSRLKAVGGRNIEVQDDRV